MPLPSHYQDWMNELLATSAGRQYDYAIIRRKNGQRYYFHDYDEYEGYTSENLIQLIWTPHQKFAYLFQTEQDVEEFKADFISPRKAAIVRLERTAASLLELLG